MIAYHASPVANRKSIESEGLTTHSRGRIYFWLNQGNAEEYGRYHDVWEAEIDGEYENYYLGVAIYVEYNVPCPTLLLTTN